VECEAVVVARERTIRGDAKVDVAQFPRLISFPMNRLWIE
jgi:hypothetical protein